jgi:hypothetical protein
MQKKDGQIAHRTILSTSWNREIAQEFRNSPRTARKLAQFADEVMPVEHLRLSESQVKRLLRTAIAEGSDFLSHCVMRGGTTQVTFG